MKQYPHSPKREELSILSLSKQSGEDLTECKKELAKERNSRSLVLRRSTRPSISQLIKHEGNKSNPVGIALDQKHNELSLDKAKTTISMNSETEIFTLSATLANLSRAPPRNTLDIIHNIDFVTLILSRIEDYHTPIRIVISLLHMIIVVFSFRSFESEQYIDSGLTFILSSLLQLDDVTIISTAIETIDAMSSMKYARDSIICLGIHELLISIALSERDSGLTNSACHTISTVFSKIEDVDSSILEPCVSSLCKILFMDSSSAVSSILHALVSITNYCPELVFYIFDLNIVPSIILLVENPSIVQDVLPLIGNLSVSNANQIKLMIKSGLIDYLSSLIASDSAADAFWVLSNLIESCPSLLLPFISLEFLSSVIDQFEICSFPVKKEISFFLSTVILYESDYSIIESLAERVGDIVIEMLGCGVGLIVLRCLDVIQKFAILVQRNSLSMGSISNLHGEELEDALRNLEDNPHPSIRAHSQSILKNLETFLQ